MNIYINNLMDEISQLEYDWDVCSTHDHQRQIKIVYKMVTILIKIIIIQSQPNPSINQEENRQGEPT